MSDLADRLKYDTTKARLAIENRDKAMAKLLVLSTVPNSKEQAEEIAKTLGEEMEGECAGWAPSTFLTFSGRPLSKQNAKTKPEEIKNAILCLWSDDEAKKNKSHWTEPLHWALLYWPEHAALLLEAIYKNTDFTKEHAKRFAIEFVRPEEDSHKPFKLPLPATEEEWGAAQIAPRCIVQNYLYCDTAIQIAPGGTGKTTLMLFEMIHVVLGKPLFGNKVINPGPVLIVTAEDSRERLIARLREICAEMSLTLAEIDKVRNDLLIADVNGMSKKLTAIYDGVVMPHPFIDEFIDAVEGIEWSVIVFDPAISFGVGESRINDAEQGLIDAARRIMARIDCCVRFIHHTGKDNAREKKYDMYSGRGGSAFADGARIVAVMHGYHANNRDDVTAWRNMTGMELTAGLTGIGMSLPKVSAVPPQGMIYLVRNSYTFSRIQPVGNNGADALKDRLFAFITEGLEAEPPRRHTATTLADLHNNFGATRNNVRGAVAEMIADGELEVVAIQPSPHRGSRTFVAPIARRTETQEPAY
jgi:hypothetical protein